MFIKLYVGNKKFVSTYETLIQIPYFESYFRFHSKETNIIKIDHDGSTLKHIFRQIQNPTNYHPVVFGI